MGRQRNLRSILDHWFDDLPTHSSTGGLPARGSVAACLAILERLRTSCVLELDAHRASGKAQLQGVSTIALTRILERHGETREFVREGGRTNRGAPGDVDSMLRMLKAMKLDVATAGERDRLIDEVQAYLVEKVREYHNRQRVGIVFDPSKTTRSMIRDILVAAETSGKAGAVAQHLVGAKLSLRFPDTSISNDAHSAADAPTGRAGDFQVGDTAFHVTISPTQSLFDKCRKNLDNGLRVYILVDDARLAVAKQWADLTAADRITVVSIESFVANNVEELSTFQRRSLLNEFRKLLEIYNRRVAAVESDRSLMIEIPPNLREVGEDDVESTDD